MKDKQQTKRLDNIQTLLNVRNKTQVWLSVELGVSKETINQYIKGTIKPRLEMLITMSKVLNTSVDYILGLTDNHYYSIIENYIILIKLRHNLIFKVYWIQVNNNH